MSDAAKLSEWQPGFEAWVEFAKPLLPQGKAQEAFGKYPWFTTDTDPFTRLDKPASEARVGLITTGGYSIEGEQEPMRGYPTFGNEAPQIRKIPTDVDRSKLVINHPGYDHKYAKQATKSCSIPPEINKEVTYNIWKQETQCGSWRRMESIYWTYGSHRKRSRHVISLVSPGEAIEPGGGSNL